MAYRFGIAAVLLYGYALVAGRRLRLPPIGAALVVLQGTLLFCLNYLLVYYATAHITSGLVAVVFSTIVLFNALNERIFFGTRIDAQLIVAGLLGLSGIAMIFWPEVAAISLEDSAIAGILLVLLSAIIASFGNMTAAVNTRRELSVVAVNAHAMAWSALLSLAIAALLGRSFTFSMQSGYVLSLAYLAVFGSAIAFGCYLALIRRIGPARAAYSSVLFPVVALGISTAIEGYQWTVIAAVGILFTLAGNWLILRGRATREQQ